MNATMAIRVQTRPASEFPTPRVDDAAILVVIGNHDPSAGPLEFEITTTLGRGTTPASVFKAIGYALHEVGHALLSEQGVVVDMTDLELPIAETLGGAS